MKMRITDLLDDYFDDSVNLTLTEAPSETAEPVPELLPAAQRETRGILRPALVLAASLLLVVMAGAVGYFRLTAGAPESGLPLAEEGSVLLPPATEEPGPIGAYEATEDTVPAIEPPAPTEPPETVSPEEEAFFELFWELDRDSVKRYLAAHPEALEKGWEGLDINESGLDQNGTEMYTVYGDQVLAVNAADGITLIRVWLSDNNTRGVLAICKDTGRLSLCPAENLDVAGQTAGEICDGNGGVLAMTGSAFMDDGYANGGRLSGLAVCGGTVYGAPLGEAGDKRLELREDNRMYIVDSSNPLGEGTRDACEFHPGLIIDGVIYYNDFWSSPNPRAVLGQSSRLEAMMVVTEGRLATSLGCGVDQISEKLAQYGCVQALNLDGGTSAMMYYKGQYVNRCSNTALPEGRALPTAWVYQPKG